MLGIISKILLFIYQLTGRVNIRNSKLRISNSSLILNNSIQVKGKYNFIDVENNVRLKSVKMLINGENNKIIICSDVRVYGLLEILIEGDDCAIFVGRGTTIGGAILNCGESNTSITLGSDCMLSRDIIINTSDFHSILDLDTGERINKPSDVNIGDHVWIGYKSRINKGASIGDNCVIAANSSVPGKEYPNNSIIAGVPSRVIRDRITWSRDKI